MICKTCNIEKKECEFYFHSVHNTYTHSCKQCTNEKRKEKYKAKRGDKFDYTRSTNKRKKCSKCEQVLELNRENFPYANNSYYKICRNCSNIKRIAPRINIPEIKAEIQPPQKIIYQSRSSDLKKGLVFDLSKEFVENSLEKACTYCGFPSTGLDRIDNTKGHSEDNCVPCCKECNVSRNNSFTQEEMIIIGKAIREVKLKRTLNT